MAPFNYRLVREVKKHRELWDHQHSKLHKEAGAREAAWADISAKLAVPVEECQTRWRTIRDTYLKRKKRLHVPITGQWSVLEVELVFLDEFLRPRTPRVLRQPGEIKPEPYDGEGPSGVSSRPPQQPVFAADVELRLLPDSPPPMPVQLPPPPPPPPVVQNRQSDPDTLFCLSLAEQLKRLQARERSLARIMVLQVLNDIEFGAADDPEPAAPVMEVVDWGESDE